MMFQVKGMLEAGQASWLKRVSFVIKASAKMQIQGLVPPYIFNFDLPPSPHVDLSALRHVPWIYSTENHCFP